MSAAPDGLKGTDAKEVAVWSVGMRVSAWRVFRPFPQEDARGWLIDE